MMNKIGRERGWSPFTRPDYDAARTLRGALFVGSPEEVVEKILFQHEIFGHDRFLIQFSVGTMPHEKLMRSIELFGTEVAPAVRAEERATRRAELARAEQTRRARERGREEQVLPGRAVEAWRPAGRARRGGGRARPRRGDRAEAEADAGAPRRRRSSARRPRSPRGSRSRRARDP